MKALGGFLLGWLASVLLIVTLALPGIGRAASASLQLSPGSVTTTVGLTFSVTLNVNTNGTGINAASGSIVFPGSLLEAVSVSRSGSIFSFWTDTPTISGETVKFGGGLPTPGYSGTKGKILTVTFRAKASGTANIVVSDGKILANDGGGTNVYSGYSGTVVTISPSLAGAAITSSTHPDQNVWYQSPTVSLAWTRPDGAQSYRYTLRKEGESNPFKTESITENSVNFESLIESTWLFELVTVFSGQERTSSFIIRIDTSPPELFEIKVSAPLGRFDRSPKLSFETEDLVSGISKYELTVGENEAVVLNEPSHQLTELKPGRYQVTVKAYDQAGNVMEVTAEIVIEALLPPVITDHPFFVSILQPITIRGTALFGAKLKIFVDGKEAADIDVKEYLTESQRGKLSGLTPPDTTVEWFYPLRELYLPGSHEIYAVQYYPDSATSDQSNRVTTNVLATYINIFGVLIPMAVAAMGLSVVVVGLSVLLWWLVRRYRRRTSRLTSYLTDVRQKVDNGLAATERDLNATIGQYSQLDGIRGQLDAEILTIRQAVDSEVEQALAEGAKKKKEKNQDAIVPNSGDGQ